MLCCAVLLDHHQQHRHQRWQIEEPNRDRGKRGEAGGGQFWNYPLLYYKQLIGVWGGGEGGRTDCSLFDIFPFGILSPLCLSPLCLSLLCINFPPFCLSPPSVSLPLLSLPLLSPSLPLYLSPSLCIFALLHSVTATDVHIEWFIVVACTHTHTHTCTHSASLGLLFFAVCQLSCTLGEALWALPRSQRPSLPAHAWLPRLIISTRNRINGWKFV